MQEGTETSEIRQTFFGKYHGKVVYHIDPMNIGRIQVIVLDISNSLFGWAMPWVIGSVRIKSMRQPLLLRDCQAVCTSTGTQVIVDEVQTRVKGN